MSKLKDRVDAATNTALARRGGDVYSIFQDQIVVKQLVGILGTEDFAKRMLLVAANELRNSEALAECTRASFLAALMHAAHLRLEVGGALGHFYLVPFKNTKLGIREVVPILGYRGILALARRSQQIESITARAVYEADAFEFEYGLEHDKLSHRPQLDGERGKITKFYGVARYTNGGVYPLVMSKAEVDKFRKRAKASESGPWETDYEPMGCKTVIRRMEPFLPLTNEAAAAIQQDEEAEREGRAPRMFDMDLTGLVPEPPPIDAAAQDKPKRTPKPEASAPTATQTPATPVMEVETTPAEQPAACTICGATGLVHDEAKHDVWAAAKRAERETQEREAGNGGGTRGTLPL